MRCRGLSIATCVGLIACGTHETEENLNSSTTGTVVVAAEVVRVAELNITRVTLNVDGVEAVTEEVPPTRSGDVFEWTLPLAAGTHELVARAFVDDRELARSAPGTVAITPDRRAPARLSVVTPPLLSMQLWQQGSTTSCDVKWASGNTTCREPLAPDYASVGVWVLDWGGAEAGTLEDLADSCGGRFERDSVGGLGEAEAAEVWRWLPPAAGGLCQVTGRATNAAGVSASVAMGVVIPPGIAPPLPFVAAIVTRNYEFESICPVVSERERDCSERKYHPGDSMSLGILDQRWYFRTPGRTEVSDTCGSTISLDPRNGAFVWSQAGTAGSTCRIRVQVTAQDGVSSEAIAQYQLD